MAHHPQETTQKSPPSPEAVHDALEPVLALIPDEQRKGVGMLVRLIVAKAVGQKLAVRKHEGAVFLDGAGEFIGSIHEFLRVQSDGGSLALLADAFPDEVKQCADGVRRRYVRGERALFVRQEDLETARVQESAARATAGLPACMTVTHGVIDRFLNMVSGALDVHEELKAKILARLRRTLEIPGAG